MTLPVGTRIDWPASLPSPRPPLIKRMCCERLPDGARCDMVLGWVVCIAEYDGEISHGMCPDCAARWLTKLPARPKSSAVSGANESASPKGAVCGPTENAPGGQKSLTGERTDK